MDTLYTLRARELLEIYRSVSMNDIPQDERVDVLLTLRRTVEVCFIFLFMFGLKLHFPEVQSFNYVNTYATLLLANRCQRDQLAARV